MKLLELRFRVLCLVVVCLMMVSPARAQLETGTITGTVQDATGAVIPGVTVTLSSPGVIGGNQRAVTDERGVYRFTRLVPGNYTVRAELPGFKAAVRESITVNADVTVRVDMTLEVGQVADAITVVGEAPLLDTTTALNQAVLNRQTLDRLPTGNDLWSIGRVVPGVLVSTFDVGGSESFQQSGMQVHGSPQSEKKYAIDGLDIAWPGGDGGSVGNYFDTGMFQEINYQVSNISAENAQGGVVVNMVTKTGTNDFHGSFMFVGSNDKFQGNNLTPALRRDLIRAIPARVLQVNPNIEPRTKILGLFDSGVTVSGPIVRDKLWFSASGKLNSLNQLVVGSYNLDGTQGVDDNRIVNGSTKISWQINANNQLHYTYNRNEKNRYHRRVATFSDARSAQLQDQEGYTTQLKWTSTLTPRMVLDATAGYSVIFFPLRHHDEVKPGEIARFDIVTSTATIAAGTYSYNPADKGATTVSLSYFAGGHDLKFGHQWTRGMNRNQRWSMSHFPAGFRARYRSGVPDSVDLYSTPHDTRVFFQHHAFYIQDKWNPTRRLTLNMGLRIEDTIGWIPAQCQPKTLFVNEQCFKEIRDVPNWLDLAPRFGLAYDIFGNGRTAFKLSANRYNLNIGTTHQTRVNPLDLATNTVGWTDRNRDGIPQLDELGEGTGFTFGSLNRYNPKLKRPSTAEYSVEIEHELPGSVVVSAGYYHRDVRRNIGSKNLAVPRQTYIPIEATEVNSGRRVTVYNLAPALRTARDFLFDNFSELDSVFNGVDLTFNKRMSNRWMLMGGLSIGANHGDSYGTDDLNDPNNTFRRGRIGTDVPVSFKLSGVYELRYGVTVSGNLQHFTGFPEEETVLVTRATVPNLTRTSQSLQINPRGTSRRPDVNIVDLSFRKTLRFGDRVSFEPSLDIFNLGNSNVVLTRTTQLGPAFHRASRILPPRVFRLGFQVNF